MRHSVRVKFSILKRAFSCGSDCSVNGEKIAADNYTNVTPKILSYLGKDIYNQKWHPLSFLRQRIINYFYSSFKGRTGNPIFSVFDKLSPVVSTVQNFDSLLVPPDHVSRNKTDCYYINSNTLLRSHMTAHQVELMRMGCNNFIMIGDVYRRDEIDSTHFPVFHQLDAVRLLSTQELLVSQDDGYKELNIKPINVCRTKNTQECYTQEATSLAADEMKRALEGLCIELFGNKIPFKWVDAYFPFTHPSWELEILLNDKWIEVLGCGIMEQQILEKGGCGDRIGWAFGLGLERLAMIMYGIPDIRIFWSQDSGVVNQFQGKSCTDTIIYKPISVFPQCFNDISFWIPENFQSNDFYEIAREVGGDMIEQIQLIDVFTNKKTGSTSHCYKIVYRHMSKTLTKEEVNKTHQEIADRAAEQLNVKIR